MILVRHLGRLLWDAVAYSIATRRLSLLLLIVLGFVLVAIASASQAAAPFVLYPFA